ncbi:MAG: hypothetical protein GY944_08640 [bacterium]|nr:hypothetical protein [bacterium]
MANTLGVYNPTFYAQEALIQLENHLGMASRVFMGIDRERSSFAKGETIQIRRPSSFTAADAPSSSAADATTETVTMTLDNYRDVKFAVTDKEFAFTGERIINDHIRPAAVALADDIDVKLNEQVRKIGPFFDAEEGLTAADIVAANRTMFDNKVPMNDTSNIFGEINGVGWADLMGVTAFTQWQGSGPAGAEAQRVGALGERYGINWFRNQNVQGDFVSGDAADLAGAVNLVGGYAVGSTSMAIDALTDTQTFTAGDTFTVAGDTQIYTLTAGATVSSNAITASFYPGLKIAADNNDVVTFAHPNGASETSYENVVFHRNAFGLVLAPLPTYDEFFEGGQGASAKIAVATDPITGLSLRARIYMMPDIAELRVTLDVLYAVQVLDPNLACRLLRDV